MAFQHGTSPQYRLLFSLVVGALAIAGLLVRTHFAAQFGLWNDEIGAAVGVWEKSLLDVLTNAWLADTAPATYNILGYLGSLIIPGEVGFRLPAIMASSLAIIVISILGYRLAGPATGIIAGALCCVAPTAIRYGYDARPYGIEVLAILLLWLCCHNFAEDKLTTRRLFILIVLLVGSLWIHYFMAVPVFILITCYFCKWYGWQATQKERQRPPVSSLIWIGSAAFFLFGLTLIYYRALLSKLRIAMESGYFDQYNPQFLWQFFAALWQTDIVLNSSWLNFREGNPIPWVLAILCGTGLLSRRLTRFDKASALLMVAAAVLLIPFVANYTRNLLSVRFAVFGLPGLLLLCAEGTRILLVVPRQMKGVALLLWPLRAAVGSVLLILLAWDVRRFWNLPYFQDWREISGYAQGFLERRPQARFIVGNRISVRNLRFYGSSGQIIEGRSNYMPPVQPDQWIAHLQENWQEPVPATVDAALNSRPHFMVRGTIPPVKVYPPVLETSVPLALAGFQADELIGMHNVALERRHGWVLADLAQAAARANNQPLALLCYQLLLNTHASSHDKAFALAQLGRYSEAVQLYEEYLCTLPDWEQRAYIWTGYAAALEALSRKQNSAELNAKTDAAYRQAVVLDQIASTTGSQRLYDHWISRTRRQR